MRSHIHPSKHSQVNGQEKHIKSSRHRIRKCIRMRCKSNGFKCENKCEKNVEKTLYCVHVKTITGQKVEKEEEGSVGVKMLAFYCHHSVKSNQYLFAVDAVLIFMVFFCSLFQHIFFVLFIV